MSEKSFLSKNFSRRSFLKVLASFVAIFSFGGISSLISIFNKPTQTQKTSQIKTGYGVNTYGN